MLYYHTSHVVLLGPPHVTEYRRQKSLNRNVSGRPLKKQAEEKKLPHKFGLNKSQLCKNIREHVHTYGYVLLSLLRFLFEIQMQIQC
jgi:hypothetical protein